MLKIKNILCAFIILFTILKPINMLNANNTIINSRRLNSANYFTSESEHLITSNPDDRKAYEMFTRKFRLMDIENQTKKSLSDLVDIYVKKN